jgi:hypothetical protein
MAVAIGSNTDQWFRHKSSRACAGLWPGKIKDAALKLHPHFQNGVSGSFANIETTRTHLWFPQMVAWRFPET